MTQQYCYCQHNKDISIVASLHLAMVALVLVLVPMSLVMLVPVSSAACSKVLIDGEKYDVYDTP